MTGRYLLVEFDSKEQAEKLMQQINAATREGKRFRVVGLFAKPGPDFCRCGPDNWISTRTRGGRTKRGPKFGWQVCMDCKKPVPVMNFLRNLLSAEDIINPTTHDGEYERKKYKMMFHSLGLTMTGQAVPRASKR